MFNYHGQIISLPLSRPAGAKKLFSPFAMLKSVDRLRNNTRNKCEIERMFLPS